MMSSQLMSSTKVFLIELYEEYLEEASFLYEQRAALLQNPAVAWRKIGGFEERLEAHIDGLVVGGKLALEVCERYLDEGDPGAIFAASSVLCRQDCRDTLLTVCEQLNPDEADKAKAIADALKYELPSRWIPDLLVLLSNGDPKLAPILATMLGYRRAPCGPELLQAARRCAMSALPCVIWALGRIRYGPSKELLSEYLRSGEEPVRFAAAIALARIGVRSVEFCLDEARCKTWPLLPLALMGGPGTYPVLRRAAATSGGDGLLAIGLHGDAEGIPFLIHCLDQQKDAPSAAVALDCITGSGLCETVFMPDELQEDELLDSEREDFRNKGTPTRGDGKPLGSAVTRLSRNVNAWSRWFDENQDKFKSGQRYRAGELLSPRVLAETMMAETAPCVLRQYCGEELTIRYGYDFPFETDLRVKQQTLLLRQAADWSLSMRRHFQEGAWYFAGDCISSRPS